MVVRAAVLENLNQTNALVVGDLILDAYVIGKAKRISPEAPVAVVKVEDEHELPGGAGNVALNTHALGSKVTLVGRIGADEDGKRLCEALLKQGVEINSLIIQDGMPTTRKHRIIADNQQIVRVDREERWPLAEKLESDLIERLPDLLEGKTVVALSDYAQGFFSRKLLGKVITASRERGIPVIVDPKGLDFSRYYGASLVKPNLSEARAAAGLGDEASLHMVAKVLLEMVGSEEFLITCGAQGMYLYEADGKHHHIPTRVREVMDVTGAGDTVLAVLTAAVGSGVGYLEGAQLANLAAGIAIERLGCAKVTAADLSRRLLHVATRRKVIDAELRETMEQALSEEDTVVVEVEGGEKALLEMFRRIKIAADRDGERTLLVKVKGDSSRELLELLGSLQEVDYILTETT